MERRWIPAAAAAVLLGLVAGRSASAGWWDDLDKGKSVSLGDVIAQPDRYQDDLVTFFCIFHRRDEVFDSLATPFHPSRYSNVSAWADGAKVWEEDTFRHDFPFLYIERSHPAHDALLATDPYTRLEVTARIKAKLRGFPCLEIVSWRVTSQRLGRAAVESVIAGDRYAEIGDDDLAYENYRRALRPDLPRVYRMLLQNRVAQSLVRLGRVDEARALRGPEILGAGDEAGEGLSPPAPPGIAAAPAAGSPDGTPPAMAAPPAVGSPDGGAPAAGSPDRPAVGSPDGGAPRAAPLGAPSPAPPPLITNDLPGEASNEPAHRASPPAPAPPPPVEDLSSPADRIPGAPPRKTPRLSGVR